MSVKIRSQRWRLKRTMLRGDAEVIDPSIHSVDIIHCQKQAKPFIEEHHYSGSFPATRLSCGLFRNKDGKGSLVGVASFSVSMNPHAGPKYTGMPGNSSVELGRLVLLDEVEANGESWFLSRAFSLLRNEKADIEAVYAYSDPVPRIGDRGAIIMPGHVGEVYQALSATCRGRARARSHFIAPNGSMISERTLSKIKLKEQGSEYATKQVLSAGVDPRRPGEDPKEWIARAIEEGQISVRRHPGNWVYTFGLTKRAKARGRNIPESARPIKNGANDHDVSSPQEELRFA